MADVYLAKDPRLGREVAVKAPKGEQLSAEMQARFEREAQAVANLDLAAIVKLYDFGEQDGRPYLVMPYMPNGSLADRLEKEGVFSLEAALAIVARVAEALDYAHEQGILHRDVKPGNILFDKNGNACLSDFGIARFNALDSDITQEHTSPWGIVRGTLAYMSPEQASGKELDGRSDIYALGVVLFEILTGERPFTVEMLALRMQTGASLPIPSILKMRDDLPVDTQEIIACVLAETPAGRYSTASALVEDLRQVIAGRNPEHARSIAKPRPKGSTLKYIIAGASAALILLLLGLYAAVAAGYPPASPTRSATPPGSSTDIAGATGGAGTAAITGFLTVEFPSPTPSNTPAASDTPPPATTTSSAVPSATPTTTPTAATTPTATATTTMPPPPPPTATPTDTPTPAPTESIGAIFLGSNGQVLNTSPYWSQPIIMESVRHYTCGGSLVTTLGDTIPLFTPPVCGIGETGTGSCVSPDGGYEVISSAVPEGTSVVVRAVGGGDPRFVYQGALDRTEGIRWSPRGAGFLFVVGDTVYIAQSDGTYSEAVPIGYNPQFSPDGVWLLYVKPVGPGLIDLFVKGMSGESSGMVANVTNMMAEDIYCPRWRLP
jgi:serine/threonine protein kinase